MPDSSIAQRLASLPHLSKPALGELWRQLFIREPPPGMRKALLLFSVLGMDASRVVMILGAFDVESAFNDWELVTTFPTRLLRVDNGEICYRILRA